LNLASERLTLDRAAVEKAKRRLAKAEACLERINRPQDSHAAFQELWGDFLLAVAGIYTVLEQGAKVSPQSRQWFGGKKRERGSDPLLQYLHQARNADEHGIAPITNMLSGRARVVSDPGARVVTTEVTEQALHIDYKPGAHAIEIEMVQPRIRLAPVTDARFNDKFDPPTEHLGNPLADQSPLNVAQLGLVYVRALVEDAERMAK
jgi:hypothetical protein